MPKNIITIIIAAIRIMKVKSQSCRCDGTADSGALLPQLCGLQGLSYAVDSRQWRTPCKQHGKKKKKSPTDWKDGKMKHPCQCVATLTLYCLQKMEKKIFSEVIS